MRWLSAILIALLLVSPLYELKVANANLNLPYLANYTPPSVIKAQLGGLYVSGGGLYLRSRYVYQPPLIQFERPRFNVGCGSIDAFLGAIGFSGFDWLVARLQQFLMNAPYVIFKVGLAVLLPQVDSVLATVEAVINQLNSLQIDQCGRITGVDVNFWNNPVEWIKTEYKKQMMARTGSQGDKNVPLDQVRKVANEIKSGNWGNAIREWNNLINMVWGDYRAVGINIFQGEKRFSFVDKVSYKVASVASPYMAKTHCLYKALVGEVYVDNTDVDVTSSSGDGSVSNVTLPRPKYDPSGVNASKAMEALLAYLTGDVDAKLPIPKRDGINTDCVDGNSNEFSLSQLSELNALKISNVRNYVRDIYNAIVSRSSLTLDNQTVKILASIPDFPALAYIQWAAIADGTGGSGGGTFFGDVVVDKTSEVLATYGACMLVSRSLAYLHIALTQNISDMYTRLCSKTLKVGDDTKAPVQDQCIKENYADWIFSLIGKLNDEYRYAIRDLDAFCERVRQEAKSDMERLRGLADEAEREARKRLNSYGVQLRGAIIWNSK